MLNIRDVCQLKHKCLQIGNFQTLIHDHFRFKQHSDSSHAKVEGLELERQKGI